ARGPRGDTPKPAGSPCLLSAGAGAATCPGATGVWGVGAASPDEPQVPGGRGGGGASHRRYYRACSAIRPLWLSQDRRTAAPGGLDNQRQAGRAYLATRGAEGPASAAQARQDLADQRILHPAAAGAAQSCLVL